MRNVLKLNVQVVIGFSSSEPFLETENLDSSNLFIDTTAVKSIREKRMSLLKIRIFT